MFSLFAIAQSLGISAASPSILKKLSVTIADFSPELRDINRDNPDGGIFCAYNQLIKLHLSTTHDLIYREIPYLFLSVNNVKCLY